MVRTTVTSARTGARGARFWLARAVAMAAAMAAAACAQGIVTPDGVEDAGADPQPDPQPDAAPACSTGEVLCAGACIDPATDTQFCGASGDCAGANAGQACAVGATCVAGACECPDPQEPCDGACTDTTADPQNCGGCGQVCLQDELCEAGACVSPALVYDESFTQGVNSDAQCTSYTAFLAQIDTGYGQVQVTGSRNPAGFTCADPALVATIADGLANGTEFHVTCGGVDWQNCVRSYGPEFWVRANTPLCDTANCPADGAMVRPCISIGTGFWGGIDNGTSSCQGPSQTMQVRFE